MSVSQYGDNITSIDNFCTFPTLIVQLYTYNHRFALHKCLSYLYSGMFYLIMILMTNIIAKFKGN